MPRTVIFDVGNVLYDWDIRYLYAKLIPDPARLEWFLANVVTPGWHFQHDRGVPFAETSAALIARFPEERALIELFGERFLETIGEPIPGMIELVQDLDHAGVTIYGITNFSDEFWRRFRPTAPVFSRFRDIIVSGREKLAKPDPAIFQLAIDRFGIAPGEALFIDDQPLNIAAAQTAGFAAHRFMSRAALQPELDAFLG
ncbi:HAD-IA family hydrolase [Pacificimonas sp. WHA3]|uniref:HAD-IA family hydrolase n=1 Tax=Pacificimonas pallii TaxID=2827236 RepID=A0ABS6SBA4_9SPHN|nr:HAD-IA family hydrolase [Pacificimonas pallii]MBV7255363.1 HAD-IA family hydrolase [Pacificimonas pallii]